MEELLDDFEDANSVDDDLVDWIDDNVDFERQDWYIQPILSSHQFFYITIE